MGINRESHFLQESLGCLLAGDLDGFASLFRSDLYWPYIVEQLQAARLDSLFLEGAERCQSKPGSAVRDMPEAVWQHVRRRAQQRRIRNESWLASLIVICSRLNDAEIIPVLVRGTDFILHEYRQPGLRPLAHLDLYVERSKITKAHRAMTKLGYTCARVADTTIIQQYVDTRLEECEGFRYEAPMPDMPPVHLHRRIVHSRTDVSSGMDEELLCQSSQDSERMGEAAVRRMSPEMMLLHCADAALRHSYRKPVALFDLACLLSDPFYGQEGRGRCRLQWDVLQDMSAKLGMHTQVFFLLELLDDLIPMLEKHRFHSQLAKWDLFALSSMRRHRFEGRPSLWIDLKRAQGMGSKSRLLLGRMLRRGTVS